MSGTSGMSSAQLMREILTYQQTAQKLRADLATVTAERDSAQTHLKISCLELDGSEAEFDAERAAHDETRKALDSLARVVGQALIIPTLEPGESLSEPLDHALIASALAQQTDLESTRDALEAQIAAVLVHAQRGLGAAWTRSTAHEELTAIVTLLTAPSTSAGEKV